MEYKPLYFGAKNITIVYLQRYLNEILKLDPPLVETGEFNNNLGDAIVQFLTRYNSLYPDKKLPMIRLVTVELFAAVGVMLGEKRLAEEIKKLEKSQPIIVKLLQGQPLVVIPPYTEEMQACDIKIASLFGGEGSVVATVFEPRTLLDKNAGGYRIDHLANDGVFHIYTNKEGTEVKTGLYVPETFEYLRGGEYQSISETTENYFRFICKKGRYKGVEIAFVHVAGTYGGDKGGKFMGKEFIETKGGKEKLIGPKNKAGSLQIGYIGGLGGEGKGYNHSHVNVYYNGARTDPRKLFC